MIGRWYSALVSFDLDITYVAGKNQLVADPLSRLFKQVSMGVYAAQTNPRGTGELPSEAAHFLSAVAHVLF